MSSSDGDGENSSEDAVDDRLAAALQSSDEDDDEARPFGGPFVLALPDLRDLTGSPRSRSLQPRRPASAAGPGRPGARTRRGPTTMTLLTGRPERARSRSPIVMRVAALRSCGAAARDRHSGRQPLLADGEGPAAGLPLPTFPRWVRAPVYLATSAGPPPPDLGDDVFHVSDEQADDGDAGDDDEMAEDLQDDVDDGGEDNAEGRDDAEGEGDGQNEDDGQQDEGDEDEARYHFPVDSEMMEEDEDVNDPLQDDADEQADEDSEGEAGEDDGGEDDGGDDEDEAAPSALAIEEGEEDGDNEGEEDEEEDEEEGEEEEEEEESTDWNSTSNPSLDSAEDPPPPLPPLPPLQPSPQLQQLQHLPQSDAVPPPHQESREAGGVPAGLVGSLLEILECPVCYEAMRPPIWQCSRGHLVCRECAPRLRCCPTCRCGARRSRNCTMEKVCQALPYPCRFRGRGCGAALPPGELEAHERAACPHREAPCRMPRCPWRGPDPQLRAHARDAHAAALRAARPGATVTVRVPVWGAGARHCRLLDLDTHVFIVHFLVDESTSELRGCVQLCGPPLQAEGFEYRMELDSESWDQDQGGRRGSSRRSWGRHRSSSSSSSRAGRRDGRSDAHRHTHIALQRIADIQERINLFQERLRHGRDRRPTAAASSAASSAAGLPNAPTWTSARVLTVDEDPEHALRGPRAWRVPLAVVRGPQHPLSHKARVGVTVWAPRGSARAARADARS